MVQNLKIVGRILNIATIFLFVLKFSTIQRLFYLINVQICKSPAEWVTTKQACRGDEEFCLLSLFLHNVYSSTPCIEHSWRTDSQTSIYFIIKQNEHIKKQTCPTVTLSFLLMHLSHRKLV